MTDEQSHRRQRNQIHSQEEGETQQPPQPSTTQPANSGGGNSFPWLWFILGLAALGLLAFGIDRLAEVGSEIARATQTQTETMRDQNQILIGMSETADQIQGSLEQISASL